MKKEIREQIIWKKKGLTFEKTKTNLIGLQGSAVAFFQEQIFTETNQSILIIAQNQEDALYHYNDLQVIHPENKVFYFPASYKMPYEEIKTVNSAIQERTEFLNFVNLSKSPFIAVTYPEAIFEKVITKSFLRKNTFEIKKGEKLSIDFLQEYFYDVEFEMQDFVHEPGQFSVRGGIIDVYSFASENPFRIELNGEEVESIRSFDPMSQLSVKKFDRINLVPNLQLGKQVEVKQNLIEFLPKGTLVFLQEGQTTVALVKRLFEKAEERYIELTETIQLDPNELYTKENEFVSLLSSCTVFEYGNYFLFDGEKINFLQSPQPSFNKNFNLLYENLAENVRRGYKNILFADSQKQAERLRQIIEDISKEKHLDKELIQPVYSSIREGFIDHELKIVCYTDHQLFERYHKYSTNSQNKQVKEKLTLKELQGLQPGDFVVHIDHGIGRYAGLEKMDVNGKQQEAVKLIYKDNDVLYISIHSLHRIAKYSGKEGQVPRIDKIGSTVWQTLKQKTKKKVKEIAFDLIKLYAKRKSIKGNSFSPDNYLQHELEASFIYEDTPDQFKATNDVKRDMEKPYPMDRLVCGDVGFGKTEVAIRAAFKAVCDGKQVAVLVPTTILALQHFKTFSERLSNLPCKVDYINRFKSSKQQKETISKLATGEIDILIGTHKLVNKEIKFKNLGFLIIDEEQKFGVAVKEKIKNIKEDIDTLTLTATPIPRTLQFSLIGARDLSVIATPPPNRYPVETELANFDEELIRDTISYELRRGGQVFFIHNKVQSITEVAGIIQRLVPEAKVVVGHGQMDGDKLEKIMLEFIEGQHDVLVATTIIESGLDIPNANTIIINDAQNFGLSDLHQMRGRVGRSNKKSFCYLLVPSHLTLTSDAKKRLKAITDFSELGSGFQIAMRDLDIRGAGDLLGGEQSGFINDMGFDTYMKILSEAIDELKEEDWYKEEIGIADTEDEDKGRFFKSFVKETQIETDLELLIPDYYVGNISERLNLYRELDAISRELDLLRFEENLKDRFGAIPKQVKELINGMRMRWAAMEIGFEKIILKNGKLIAYFLSKPDSEYFNSAIFKNILKYAQQHPSSCKLKEGNNKLSITIERIKSIEDVIGLFNYIRKM